MLRIIKLVLLFLIILTVNGYAKIIHFTLLEKTRGSEIVLLAKCIRIQDEKYKLQLGRLRIEREANRFADYKIIEIWKGRYDKDILTLDYKLTNERYKPFGCQPAVCPAIDELIVLFIEKGATIFAGFQGKISVNKDEVSLYKEAIKKFIELDTFRDKEKVLATIKMIDDNNPYVKESVLGELHKIDNTAYGIEIARLLEHKDVLVRQRAMSALVGTKDKKVVSFVIRALKDSDPRVRADATTVLWRIDDERITPVLMESFNDESADVRRGVIFALSRRNIKEAIPLYYKALKDGDPLVRSFGANAFEWVDTPEAVPELLNALKDESPDVRSSAVRVLYVYIRCNTVKPDDEIIEAVIPLLIDKDKRVRNETTYFMATVGWSGYSNMLKNDKIINKLLQIAETDESYLARSSAIDALGTAASSKAIPILISSLSDLEFQIRASAATAFFKIGDKTILPRLREALKNEKNEYVEECLKNAIRKLESLEKR